MKGDRKGGNEGRREGGRERGGKEGGGEGERGEGGRGRGRERGVIERVGMKEGVKGEVNDCIVALISL